MRNYFVLLCITAFICSCGQTSKDRKLEEMEHQAHQEFVDSAIAQMDFVHDNTEEVAIDIYVTVKEDTVSFRLGFYNNDIHKITFEEFQLFETWLGMVIPKDIYIPLIIYVADLETLHFTDPDQFVDRSVAGRFEEIEAVAREVWYLCLYQSSHLNRQTNVKPGT